VTIVDTSVWIDVLRDGTGAEREALSAALRDDEAALTRFTQLELLQGARDEREWGLLHASLETQTYAEARHSTWAVAGRIYFGLRRMGRTVRSAIDGAVHLTHRTPRMSVSPEDREQTRAVMEAAHVRPYLDRYRLPVARMVGDLLILEDAHYHHVSRDVAPAWVAVPRGPSAGPSTGEVSAHLVVTGVQPLVWGGVVLCAWVGGRRRLRLTARRPPP
jgi:predicted nucleic acid-binding protein